MKSLKLLLTISVCCILCSCQKEENTQVEIEKHIYVENEFIDSWLERCSDGRTYLQLVIDGGYNYQTDKKYLNRFFDDGGKIELYNYSIKKDDLIISGEFIENETIILMHPNLNNIISEGVLMHELGHYFDYRYQFSNSNEFKKMYEQYSNDNTDISINDSQKTSRQEFFAELFKIYLGNISIDIPDNLKEYMKNSCEKILEDN